MVWTFKLASDRGRAIRLGGSLAFISWLMVGCATPLTVPASEIPLLEQQLAAEPSNPAVLQRYAAGLYDAGNCAQALPVAQTAIRVAPRSEIGPLVAGQCLERDGQYAEALGIYRDYLRDHPREVGAPAVRARAELAARSEATRLARAAMAQESQGGVDGDPEATGVLPVVVVGDTTLAPLSLGLAHMLTTDLTLLERFRVLERIQLQALMDEMSMSSTERVDPETAVRVGRLAQAGRLVQGTMVGALDESAQLDAAVVLASGDVVDATGEQGPMRDLITLEKQLVISMAEDLGYRLTETERRRILDSGPHNLKALLAFSNGLRAESLGNWAAAAEHYGAAVRADPSFAEARQKMEVAAGIVATQSAPANSPVGSAADDLNRSVQDQMRLSGVDSQRGVRLGGIIDLTGHQSERAPPADPINIVVDPPRGPETSSFLVNLILRLRIPGR